MWPDKNIPRPSERNTENRYDNTAALQEMMLQSIQKALEMMNQLYQIQNQGAGSIIRNMA